MKRILTLVFTSICILSYAQDGINYQGAATDSNGDALVNQSISLKTSILSGTATGTIVFSETHSTTTDQFGLFNVVIGQGNSISGVFDDIDWGANNHFLQVELDENGGSNYTMIATTQMMSVPYALHAKNAGLDSAAVADMLTSMNISGNSGSSFDLNFPQGYNGEVISHDFYADGGYQVPANKILYISYLYTFSQHEVKIDNDLIAQTTFGNTWGNAPTTSLHNPIIMSEGQTITYHGTHASFHGILMDKIDQIVPITHHLYSNFTVPSGKKLVLTNICYNNPYQQIHIDNVPTFKGYYLQSTGNHSGNVLGQPVIVDAGKVIYDSSQSGTINGYLVDEDYFDSSFSGSGGDSGSGNNIDVSVSTFGDSLIIGDQSFIVPGISVNNNSPEFDTVTDIDGNIYQTVNINGAVWMMENLKVGRYSNGDLINYNPGCNSAGYYYVPNPGGYGDQIWYNGYAVDDTRNICPTGWHVATADDYHNVLNIFVSSSPSSGSNYGGIQWNNVAQHLKNIRDDLLPPTWTYNGSASNPTNYSYLSIISISEPWCGGATSHNPSFQTATGLWTSTNISSSSKYHIRISNTNDIVELPSAGIDELKGVRCVKD